MRKVKTVKAPKIVKDFDDIDEAAECEGRAMNRIRACYFTDEHKKGRRLIRQGNKDSRGVAILRKNRIQNLTNDHNKVAARYIIGSE